MARSRWAVSFGEKLDLDLVVGEQAPSATQALVVPQDIHLIMGDVDPIEDTRETAEEVLAGAAAIRPRRPGSVVIVGPREGPGPLVLQAIVYDFDRSPPSREEHVFEALLAAFEVAKGRGLSSVAVRPLGTAYSGVEAAAFLRILTQICYSSAELGTTVRHVHVLLASPGELERYEALLQELIHIKQPERQA